MKPLPKTFREGGFDFRIELRTPKYAMLAKSRQGGRTFWETVIIQHRPAETIRGRSYPAREVMPRSEQWGEQARSCDTEERALAHLIHLVRNGRFLPHGIAQESFCGVSRVQTAETQAVADLQTAMKTGKSDGLSPTINHDPATPIAVASSRLRKSLSSIGGNET